MLTQSHVDHPPPRLVPYRRLPQLDALRGIAALSVLLHHHLLVLPEYWSAYASGPDGIWQQFWLLPPLFTLTAGHSAVVLFFVMSGFVLALPILQGHAKPYHEYAIKRACRLWLPYVCFVALAMMLAGLFYTGPQAGVSAWFNSSWTEPPSPWAFFQHAQVIRAFDSRDFVNPIWSLIHEMRISLFFPLLVWVIVRLRAWGALAFSAALSAVGIWAPRFVPSRLEVAGSSYADTVHYAAFFAIGILLAKNFATQRMTVWARFTAGRKWTLGAIALVCYSWEGYLVAARSGSREERLLLEWPTAIGAACLLLLLCSARWQPARSLLWVGKVSYSLYLCHVPVLLAVIHAGAGLVDGALLFGVSLLLSLGVAALGARFVEQPSVALAARWFRRAPFPTGMHPANSTP